jgi:hypothetical protein
MSTERLYPFSAAVYFKQVTYQIEKRTILDQIITTQSAWKRAPPGAPNRTPTHTLCKTATHPRSLQHTIYPYEMAASCEQYT